MSTGIRVPLAKARAAAERFRSHFPESTWASWTVAGSIRRNRPQCGDCEHVVIPRVGQVRGDDLFSTPMNVNLLWRRMDQLLAAGTIKKHAYGTTGCRWGEKYRGCELDGMLHEIWTATPANLGSVLAIRTGPPDFSILLVRGLRCNRLRNVDGDVWQCDDCACRPPLGQGGRLHDPLCERCGGTGLVPTSRVNAPDELEFFRLAGAAFIPPEDRA